MKNLLHNSIMVSVIMICTFFCVTSASCQIPPVPARICGIVVHEGELISRGQDEGLEIHVTNLEGKQYLPHAVDADGLDRYNGFIVDIPIYDEVIQPNGAKPGEQVKIHVFMNDIELDVLSPPKGEIRVDESGSIWEIPLQIRSPININ